MSFQSILVKKDGTVSLQELTDEQLPEGEVTVAVEYSTINYKDGLCMQAGSPLVKEYPHVPGIDFSGTVESSHDPRYQTGDKVILTGWGVGERHWGGLSQKARVNADWLVPLPAGLSAEHAMTIGTAGMAAMLAIIALEEHGLEPSNGEVLVTGATGGVGSVATAILNHLGYQVAAVTGNPQAADYLEKLGAKRIISRDKLNSLSPKPLEAATWAGCIDAVGGDMLARVIGQLKYGASVAAVGLAGGAKLSTSVIPFLLRGVNLLGIDSVQQPYHKRLRAWQRLSEEFPYEMSKNMVQTVSLAEVPDLGTKILKGEIQGRVIVEVNA